MQPSDYYPEGLKAASIATNAHCVAQAAAGGLRSMEEGQPSPFIETLTQPGGFLSALRGLRSIHVRQFISFISRM